MNPSMNAAFDIASRASLVGRARRHWTTMVRESLAALRHELAGRLVATRTGSRGEAQPMSVERSQSVWFEQPRGLRVACESGTLWLTFDGEPRDILLGPGQSHVCQTDARLLVHALTAGAFRAA